MKVLVTGFEPFGGEEINPSYEAVKGLENQINGAEIVKAELPVVFGKAILRLEGLIGEVEPDIVICVGQAGGRFGISIERVAVNVDDARVEDNEGNKPVDKPVVEGGNCAYFSNLPIKAMVENIRKANIPASVSNSAGTYVCNHIMYGLLHLIHTKYKSLKGGFIHVPYIPTQIMNKWDVQYMELDKITMGLSLAISASVNP